MKNPPAFQWYAAEYLADEKVQIMSLEEEGAYIRLLSYCWREGSIPSNIEHLSRLCKGASTTLVTGLLGRFVVDPNNPSRLLHERLEKERKKQQEWRERCSRGGSNKGTKKTKKYPSKGAPTLQFASSVLINKTPTPLPFTSLPFLEVWDEWVEHRQQIRKKLTSLSVHRQFKQFREIGEERTIKAITHSIAQGWTGIFEDSHSNGTPTKLKPSQRSQI